MVRRLSESEIRLWRRVSDTARPLRRAATSPPGVPAILPLEGEGSPSPPAARPTGQPRRGAERANAPLPDASGHRRIRRGQVDIEDRIDLHGLTYEAARRALILFVLEARARGSRRLLVITGKGRTSGGVLRRALPIWLGESELRPLVSGLSPAHVRHGGEGAFYLLLKG